jgi:hypothetical protein
VMDDKRTSLAGYPGNGVRFVGPNTRGELAVYLVGRRLYLLHAFGAHSDRRCARNLSPRSS